VYQALFFLNQKEPEVVFENVFFVRVLLFSRYDIVLSAVRFVGFVFVVDAIHVGSYFSSLKPVLFAILEEVFN